MSFRPSEIERIKARIEAANKIPENETRDGAACCCWVSRGWPCKEGATGWHFMFGDLCPKHLAKAKENDRKLRAARKPASVA